MQLKPGEQFTIVRQLDNPADSGTYYVQAVIRNSKTDEVLATLNLDDKGGQRFTKSWQVVPDTSGEGIYIDVESRVFTDSGHTTYSDVYAKENAVYLVADRALMSGGNGGFGFDAPEVDYKRIRAMMVDVISGQDTPKAPKLNLRKVLDRIDALQAFMEQIEPPETPEPVDLEPVLTKIDQLSENIGQLGQKIDDKEVTPETDLTPVMEKIDGININEMNDQIDALIEKMRQFFGTDLALLGDKIQAMHDMIGRAPFIPLPSVPIDDKKVETAPKRKRNIL